MDKFADRIDDPGTELAKRSLMYPFVLKQHYTMQPARRRQKNALNLMVLGLRLLRLLDGLRGAAQYGDVHGWRDEVERLERDWFAPLADMLKKGQIAQLSIAAVDGERCRELTVERGELWKFWRGKKPLTGYL